MTELPNLRIGCSIWFKKGAFEVQCVPLQKGQLCPTCQHNSDIVKAHAAAYQKVMDSREGTHSQSTSYTYNSAKERHDAVLELLPKELKKETEAVRNDRRLQEGSLLETRGRIRG